MDDMLKLCEEGERLGREVTPGPWSAIGGIIFNSGVDDNGRGCFIVWDRLDYKGPECNRNADAKCVSFWLNNGPALAAAYRRQCEELATLRDELAEVKRGYDWLDANWDRLNNVNVGTFRNVLNMPDASIPEMVKMISDTKADRDRMREALSRIAVESLPLVRNCPPKPHACPVCEISYVACEALAATEGK